MDNQTYTQGKPAKFIRSPLSCWFGGKYILSSKIIPLIPDHICYVEPFFGAGWVFFRKRPSPIEVINDINSDLANFWECLRKDPSYMLQSLEWAVASREIFESWRDMGVEELEALSPDELAWRLFYIAKLAFSGRGVCGSTLFAKRNHKSIGKPSFTVCKRNMQSGRPAPKNVFSMERLAQTLRCAHARLTGQVRVENCGWQKCVSLYDAQETFFYFDPPYVNNLNAYGRGVFSLDELASLAKACRNMRGKFILSLDDTETGREIFSGFSMFQIGTRYRCNNKISMKRASELLITNYEPGEAALKKGKVLRLA